MGLQLGEVRERSGSLVGIALALYSTGQKESGNLAEDNFFYLLARFCDQSGQTKHHRLSVGIHVLALYSQ
jgi:hypothetical protein